MFTAVCMDVSVCTCTEVVCAPGLWLNFGRGLNNEVVVGLWIMTGVSC